MSAPEVRWPDSLWAAVTPPGPGLPELTGSEKADVIVIGGGFTGLSNEQDFLPCSFGFRPGRSAHQALQSLRTAIMSQRLRGC